MTDTNDKQVQEAKAAAAKTLIDTVKGKLKEAFDEDFGADTVASLIEQTLARKKKKPIVDLIDQHSEQELVFALGEAVLLNRTEKRSKYEKEIELYVANKELDQAARVSNTLLNDHITHEDMVEICDKYFGAKYHPYKAQDGKTYILTKKKLRKELGMKF